MRKDKVYCDTCELAYNMYMYSHNPDGDSTILIAGYEIVSEMLKDLMQFEDTTAFSIYLDNPEMEGYEDEYILTLDDEQNVWVEPFKNKVTTNRNELMEREWSYSPKWRYLLC